MSAVPETPVDEAFEAMSEQDRQRLEAEVERLRLADEARRAEPKKPVDWKRQVEQLLQRSQAERRGAPVEDFPVFDDVREYQLEVRRNAWRRCLVEANHDDYLAMNVDRLDAEQHAETIRYFAQTVGRPDAKVLNLILVGSIGAGKTSAAISAGHLAVAAGRFVRFATHQQYLDWLRPDGAPSGRSPVWIREQHERADLLILDDLGAEENLDEEASKFVRKETNELLGNRLASGRPTIVTTNLSSEDLSVMLGARMVSRLGARGHVLKFIGEDRRQPIKW